MDIQADIKWIVAELQNVKDPHLVSALKHLLKYSVNRDKPVSIEQYNQEVKAAEQRIAAGEYVTHEDIQFAC